MKKLSIVFLALVLASTAGCDKKKGADKGAGGDPKATTAPTDKKAPPAAAAKLVELDLSVVGPDWAGLTIMAPEGATVKEDFGAGAVNLGDHFQLQIHSDKVDMVASKKEADDNDINKVKRYLVDSPDAILFESEAMRDRPEFHFLGNVKAGDKELSCEDTKGPQFTQADVEAMWKACQSITKK
jgi:hypothetical protein